MCSGKSYKICAHKIFYFIPQSVSKVFLKLFMNFNEIFKSLNSFQLVSVFRYLLDTWTCCWNQFIFALTYIDGACVQALRTLLLMLTAVCWLLTAACCGRNAERWTWNAVRLMIFDYNVNDSTQSQQLRLGERMAVRAGRLLSAASRQRKDKVKWFEMFDSWKWKSAWLNSGIAENCQISHMGRQKLAIWLVDRMEYI